MDSRDDELTVRDSAVRHQSLYTWLSTYPSDRYVRLYRALTTIIEQDPRALPRRYDFNRWCNALIEFRFIDTNGNDVVAEEKPSDRARRLKAQAAAKERSEKIRDALASRGYAPEDAPVEDAEAELDPFDETIIQDLPLMELLLQAEAEWRVDCATKVSTRKALDIQTRRVDPALDWRNPDADRETALCDWQPHTAKGPGRMCGRPAIPGTRRCVSHGGELIDVDTRRAILMSAYGRIVGAIDTAIDTLIDVAANSRNAIARVNAAKEILDRAGLSPELQVRVRLESDNRDARVTQLLDQLDEMQSNMEAVPTTAKIVSDLTTKPPPEVDPDFAASFDTGSSGGSNGDIPDPGPEPVIEVTTTPPPPRHQHFDQPQPKNAMQGRGTEPF